MGLGGGWNQDALQAGHIAQAQASVEAALDIGITLFDHANIYTLGKAEQCFGAPQDAPSAVLATAQLVQALAGEHGVAQANPYLRRCRPRGTDPCAVVCAV